MIFSLKRMLIPFSTRNFVIRSPNAYFGYTEYFIFGIRVAQIQRTKPWGE